MPQKAASFAISSISDAYLCGFALWAKGSIVRLFLVCERKPTSLIFSCGLL